ncbi:MAG: PHP domain-containing protein [Bacilli bacterium]|jgi:histidinol-phosphatase (PHP family)|nr:PHP domain-containing protein [Bacilli bacterium]
MKYTLHNHTYLCKHASGDAFEMVDEALSKGYDLIGVSDHIPYPDAEVMYRMDFNQKALYLNELKLVKEKYALQPVRILCGFEAEYQVRHLDYLKGLFINKEIDYLVLGQHYQDVADLRTYYGRIDNIKLVKQYVDECIEAFKTNLFWIFVHPDIFLMSFTTIDQEIINECTRLIKAANEYQVLLEYNAGGVRFGLSRHLKQDQYPYPKKFFWQLVEKLNGQVVVNADAHSPQHINDIALKLAVQQAQELNLNLVEPDYDNYYQRVKTTLKIK